MNWTPKREEQFLDALYLGVRDRAGFDASLGLLGDLFDVKTTVLLDFDPARPEVATQASTGLLSGANMERYQREFAHLDPAPRAFMAMPAGTAVQTYRLLPQETKKPSVFFGEFFRPIGLEECLGGTLASRNGRFAMIGMQRTPCRKPFDEEDVTLLEKLMPHLDRALQLRRSLVQLEATTIALTELCDRLACGITALDDQGRSVFVNAAARRIAAAGDGLTLDRGGRMFATNRDAARKIAEFEVDVRTGGSGGIVRVPRPDDKPSYAVVVAPYVVDHPQDGGTRRRHGVMFLVHDPMSGVRPAAETIGALLGLPRATASLVAALVTDGDPFVYAESAGISMNTVRYHLKIAYARTGVRRQSELVRLASNALRDLADHREIDRVPPEAR